MILRLWRGWPAAEHAQAYEDLLTGTIAPAILDRRLAGLRDLTVLRRVPAEVDPAGGGEVLTAMTFDDLAAVAAFTGGDVTASVVPPQARRLLAEYDGHSRHYASVARYARR